MNETSDGIVSPELSDEYALVADLGALAESVQLALEKRANMRIGTQVEREAANVPVGTLWRDTTGSQALYMLQGTGWARVWPDVITRSIVVGTYTSEIGYPFITLREAVGGERYSQSLESIVGATSGEPNLVIGQRVAGELKSRWDIRPSGQILHRRMDEDVSRSLPFAYRQGSLVVAGGSYAANEIFTRTVVFPEGFFTDVPHINLTPLTGLPAATFMSIGTRSKDQFVINCQRAGTNAAFTIAWEATQAFPASE